jgi:Ca2+:H+ antiporter
VVKASLVGSVLGNVLLVLGGAMAVGGWRRERQTFNRTAVQAYAGMLLLAVAVLLLPSLMQLARGRSLPSVGAGRVDFPSDLDALTVGIAAVLLLSYAGGMLFSLRTHRRFFNPPAEREHANTGTSTWVSVARLAVAGVLVGVTSEIMVGEIARTAEIVGISEFFIGVVVVAIVGNAAEHWVAVLAGYRDQMHLAIAIALGSSAQIALVVAPLLALLSFALPTPLPLVFNVYEIGALIAAVLIANYVTGEGESTWFEGVQLLALYAALGVLFFLA